MSEKLRFGEILVRAGVLERAQLEQIGASLAESADLGEHLVRQGLIDESRMLQAVGQALNLPTVVLTELNPDERALKLLPQALCEQYRVFPVELEQTGGAEHLHVAMANPADIRGIKQITRKARRRIRPLVASARDISEAIAVHYAGATRHRTDGSVQDSPVDMFDFSVTDLSSIDASDPGPAL
ncbi:MAG: type IV pilus assembly protein PilB, partial [Bradymonadia bacterium]